MEGTPGVYLESTNLKRLDILFYKPDVVDLSNEHKGILWLMRMIAEPHSWQLTSLGQNHVA